MELTNLTSEIYHDKSVMMLDDLKLMSVNHITLMNQGGRQ